ncbi:MAG: hypothetical protein ACWA5T_00010 [Parvularcula sp.]
MNRKLALFALVGWVFLQLAGVIHSVGHDLSSDHNKSECALCHVVDHGGNAPPPAEHAVLHTGTLSERVVTAFYEAVLARPGYWAPPPGRAPPHLT